MACFVALVKELEGVINGSIRKTHLIVCINEKRPHKRFKVLGRINRMPRF